MFGFLRPKEETNPATTDIASGGRSDTRNRWHRLEADFPGNRNDGRTAVMTTDVALQIGPAPDRIDSVRYLTINGKTGPHGNSDNPMQRAFIGRVPIMHIAQLPSPAGRKTIDDNAHIPALFVGNPVGD